MIPNKPSVGSAVQLQFWKSCALCHFFGFDKNVIFLYVHALQPKGVPSFLLMDLRTFFSSFLTRESNIGTIEAILDILQRHRKMRVRGFDFADNALFWHFNPSFKDFSLLQAMKVCYSALLVWKLIAKCTINSILSKFEVISLSKKLLTKTKLPTEKREVTHLKVSWWR